MSAASLVFGNADLRSKILRIKSIAHCKGRIDELYKEYESARCYQDWDWDISWEHHVGPIKREIAYYEDCMDSLLDM